MEAQLAKNSSWGLEMNFDDFHHFYGKYHEVTALIYLRLIYINVCDHLFSTFLHQLVDGSTQNVS